MSQPHWDLTVSPTAAEVYEGMVLGGRAMLSLHQRVILILQSAFIGVCAPVGAAMIVWAIVMAVGGRTVIGLPVWALPVTFLVFVMISLWLTRQASFMLAQITVQSRFGRSQQVKLDPDGITLTTTHSHWHSGWADVDTVCGGKLAIALRISGIAITVPRRAFLGPQDADEALSASQAWQRGAR
ncbi:MAG: hypothetical protein V7661_12880 [Sulfitobacter sp.]